MRCLAKTNYKMASVKAVQMSSSCGCTRKWSHTPFKQLGFSRNQEKRSGDDFLSGKTYKRNAIMWFLLNQHQTF